MDNETTPKTETVPVGAFEVNCYLLYRGAEAVIIDPGADSAELSSRLEAAGRRPAAYMLTHGHCDHIDALAELHKQYPAPVYMNRLDSEWAFDTVNQLPPYYSIPARPAAKIQTMEDGQVIEAAGLRMEVIATPGHTPGGVCLLCPRMRAVFTGDTIFRGSVGRTDLPGGEPRTLARSLKRLTSLPRDWKIYPGHGPASTMAEEIRGNFYLQRPTPD